MQLLYLTRLSSPYGMGPCVQKAPPLASFTHNKMTKWQASQINNNSNNLQTQVKTNSSITKTNMLGLRVLTIDDWNYFCNYYFCLQPIFHGESQIPLHHLSWTKHPYIQYLRYREVDAAKKCMRQIGNSSLGILLPTHVCLYWTESSTQPKWEDNSQTFALKKAITQSSAVDTVGMDGW